ncbi:hypothetical protein [Acanthopleuribacter pedis]|uniref:Uncharacterized protein n=1 Tax=Acanthopleuribacter pedis TaxID=442870 RepID=A0A8J7QFQ9_9BACT|nr:hypothetical protein [Acanthopleuribacter pedis]MBO1323269.1 hypothetical protein [Acanthopleuribacter pedis]
MKNQKQESQRVQIEEDKTFQGFNGAVRLRWWKHFLNLAHLSAFVLKTYELLSKSYVSEPEELVFAGEG